LKERAAQRYSSANAMSVEERKINQPALVYEALLAPA